MISVNYCTFSTLSLLPLGRICFCFTLPGFRNPITPQLCVIPVLLVVLAALCGRKEGQQGLWLGCLSCETPVPLTQHNELFQENSSKSRALAKVTWCQSQGCWQVSWLCWAPSNTHLLPGVLRVTGRCFLGTTACCWWSSGAGSVSVGTGKWEAAGGEWLGRDPGAAKQGPALAQGWISTALKEEG